MTEEMAGATRSTLVGWLCIIVAMLEGFELQVAGIAAPNLKAEMGLPPVQLGWFFSASTIGLLIGAIVGGRLADRIGRGPVLIWSVAGFGLASILTGLAEGPGTLIAARGLTGVGLGGALPNLLALTSENAAPGREKRAVALLYCGVPVGGAAVSLTGAAVSDEWRLLFMIGGIPPLLVAWLLFRLLPRGNAGGHGGLRRDMNVRTALFGEGRTSLSLLLWASFFATLIILYLVLNWLPTLLTGSGLDQTTAFIAQIAFNGGGIICCAATAPLLDTRRGWLVALVAFTAIPIFLWSALRIDDGASAIIISCALGGAVLVTQSYLYALAPTLYPTAGRGTGVGAAVAAGRIGSIAGPLLGAVLLASGGDTASVLRGTLPVALFAAVAAVTLSLLAQRRQEQR